MVVDIFAIVNLEGFESANGQLFAPNVAKFNTVDGFFNLSN